MNFGEITNFVFFGGGYVLLENAIRLKTEGKKILVVTSPRQAVENVLTKTKESSLEEHFKLNDICYIVIENLKEFDIQKNINQHSLGISFGAAWIFQKEFIDIFEGRLLNLHPSNLPLNRGGGGFSWIIMQGQRFNSNTIHILTPGIDDGDIVLQQDFDYPEECRLPSDYQKFSNKKSLELMEDFFKKLENNYSFNLEVQELNESSYWPRLNTNLNGFINWNWSLIDIYRFICAFDNPYNGASTYLGQQRVYLHDCRIDNDTLEFHPYQIGIVYKKVDNVLFISTSTGSLSCKSVYDENGSELIENIKVGDRFFTPIEKLEESMKTRIFYNSKGLV